jgi:hypothetical protein
MLPTSQTSLNPDPFQTSGYLLLARPVDSTKIMKRLEQAWIDGWTSETHEPGTLVVTVRINHAGYLHSCPGLPAVPRTNTRIRL